MITFRRIIIARSKMARPISSLGSFISQAREAAHAQNGPRTIVTGNESADLDSLSSSILYAYLKHLDDGSRTYIPLVNIPHSEVRLRPEFTWLLQLVDLQPHSLITLDTLQALDKNTEFALVDHNALTGSLQQYQSKVNAVIDHHEDEHQVAEDVNPRIIQKSGSCSSLVVNDLKSVWEKHLSSHPEVGSVLATLAIGAIVIDTTNLSQKVTENDTESLKFLEEKWSSSFSREQFFADLQRAKADLSGLSVTEILRKDFKSWSTGLGNLGISSCVKDLAWVVQKAKKEESAKESFLSCVESFASERKLAVWAFMSAFSDESGSFNRELIIWTKDKGAREQLQSSLDGLSKELKLKQWNGGDLDSSDNNRWIMAWTQNAHESSRKQVAPLLRRILDPKRQAKY